MKNLWSLVGLMCGAAACWWLVAGCEVTSSVDNVISVSPATVTLDSSNLVTTFTATAGTNSTLVLPLEWSVKDASLGSILSSAGMSAVYKSSGAVGSTTVLVHDQARAEGLALVTQQ